MGFENSLFLSQPVDENLTCSICRGVYDKPSTACSNGHVYCLGCLSETKKRSNACPGCRQEMFNPAPPIRPLENLIGGLKLCCENSVPKKTEDDRQEPPATRRRTTESGEAVEGDKKKGEEEEVCKWQGLVSEYRQHMKSCPFRIVKCPLKCKAKMEHRLLDHHKKNECLYRTVPCDRCKAEVEYRLLDHHQENDCLHAEDGTPSVDACVSKIREMMFSESIVSQTQEEFQGKEPGTWTTNEFFALACNLAEDEEEDEEEEDDETNTSNINEYT